VLIHSPLVGPSSWRWVADELTARGLNVIVPSLLAGAIAGDPLQCIDAVVAATPDIGDATLVGHSGAGPLLPLIADRMERRAKRLIFVDAGIPPAGGEAVLIPDDFATHLRSLANGDGVLPPWSEWFGANAIDELVPDDQRRRDVIADMPQIPLRYFDARITLPDRWPESTSGGYILLSEIYRPDAIAAGAHGWPVVEMIGAHLDVVTRPTAVADAIKSLAAGV
jgi:pimeloyl-ACP methyl ester carboxylesterase